jgi:phosphoribosylanthranilate isomerase
VNDAVRVKICGLTRLEDALLAADAGADLLGFILYPGSKRATSAEQVKEMAAALRRRPACPLLVGVFVNEPLASVAATLERSGLDLAQLHGDEPPSWIGEPSSPLYGRSYKALRPLSLAEAEADAEWFVPPNPVAGRPTLMIDAYHPSQRGGTGETADWTIAARLVAAVPGLMLAGGLKPTNVAAAVRQVRPFAVDVASGVESAPGRKDAGLVRAFIKNARSTDSGAGPLLE